MILKSTFSSFIKRAAAYSISNFSTCRSLLISKKKFSSKNVFAFESEFQKQFSPHASSKDTILSGDLLLNLDNAPKKRDNPNCNQSYPKPRSSKKKKMLPSLTYRGEIVYGIHPVYLALSQKKRLIHQLYVRKEVDSVPEDALEKKKDIISLAESLKVPISFVDSKGLRVLAPDSVHQGVCLDAGFLPLKVWIENESDTQNLEKPPLWLVLDEILDPMNVGAIIRSAYYFGVDRIFTVMGNSCKLSPTVSKASSGALEVIDLYQLENLEEFIKARKSKSWSIVSTVAYSTNRLESDQQLISASEFDISNPTVLILGNEGTGVSKTIQNLCEAFISIEPRQDLHKGLDSLNVSVAAGVLLYALTSKILKR